VLKGNNGLFYIEGHFEDEQLQGEGTLIFPNGSKFEGQFKDGLRDGPGIMYSVLPDGSLDEFGTQVLFRDGEQVVVTTEYDSSD
jgi:hypothetical protein